MKIEDWMREDLDGGWLDRSERQNPLVMCHYPCALVVSLE